MIEWINLWYNSFVNRWQLPLLCKKTGALALVLRTWSYSRLASRQNSAKFRIIESYIPDEMFGFSWCLIKIQCYYSCTNAF